MKRTRRVGWVAGLLTLVMCLGGCSWIVMRQADANYSPTTAKGPPDCTASLGPAIGDTWDAISLGGGLVATGTASIVLPSVEPIWGVLQLAGGVGLGAMFGTAAAHGYTESARCRRLRDQFQIELRRRLDGLEGGESADDPPE